MIKPYEVRYCATCDKELHGRADKKFCDDQCRTMFNNQSKPRDSLVVKNINAILRKNKAILEQILSTYPDKNTTRISLKKLNDLHFNFSYSTHQLNTKNGVYIFCYEYGYRKLDEQYVMVVKSLD